MKRKDVCIYCNESANTKDHVPPRCFLDEPYPLNMTTVPACSQCNESFSKDEQYIMYLSDYLFSIEYNDGDFSREKAELTFAYNDKLEDRMIDSLKVVDNLGVYFNFEYERIIFIIRKISVGLLFLVFGNTKRVEVSNFIPNTHLSFQQKEELENIKWIVVQENRFKYFISDTVIYFIINEVLLCLSKYGE